MSVLYRDMVKQFEGTFSPTLFCTDLQTFQFSPNQNEGCERCLGSRCHGISVATKYSPFKQKDDYRCRLSDADAHVGDDARMYVCLHFECVTPKLTRLNVNNVTKT